MHIRYRNIIWTIHSLLGVELLTTVPAGDMAIVPLQEIKKFLLCEDPREQALDLRSAQGAGVVAGEPRLQADDTKNVATRNSDGSFSPGVGVRLQADRAHVVPCFDEPRGREQRISR